MIRDLQIVLAALNDIAREIDEKQKEFLMSEGIRQQMLDAAAEQEEYSNEYIGTMLTAKNIVREAAKEINEILINIQEQ